MIRPDEWYRCVACGAMFDDQLQYERHLFAEHNRLRDTLGAVIGDEEPAV